MRETAGSETGTAKAVMIGIIGVVIALVLAVRFVWAVVAVPTTEDAMRLSIEKIRYASITKAIAARPDACSIKGTPGFGWSVACLDIERTATSPGSWCRSVWWDIDPWGKPTNPNGTGGTFASLEDNCHDPSESR